MPLIKRQDKRVTRTAILIAVGLHVLLFVIFWNVGGDVIIKDFVAEMTTGRHGPPPPPPKKAPPKVRMKAPPKVQPKFKVKTPPVRPSIKPDFNTSVLPSMDMSVPEPDYTQMAMDFGTVDIGTDQGASFSIAAMDVLGKLDIDLTSRRDKHRKSNVFVSKKRTRGNFSWTNAQYNAANWNQFVSDGGFKNFMNHVNTSTSIDMDANSRTINLEYTFNYWLKAAKETIVKKESIEKTPENELLDELKRSIYELTKPDINAKANYIDLLWDTFDKYLYRKYEFRIKGRALEDIMKDVEKQGVEPWRLEGIREVITNLQKFDNIVKYLDGSELRPLWIFAKKAEVLESPILAFRGGPGLGTINEEMIQILRTYIQNGGFIWMDDSGEGGNSDASWQQNRVFIQKLSKEIKMDEVTKQVYKRLSQEDQLVPGYDLVGHEPTNFHPYTNIYFNLPEKNQVHVRVFNKLGLLVKEFDLGELSAGTYTDKKTALKWHCKNQKGEDVGSGIYFYQMEAGLFKQTKTFSVSNLRMIDSSHPLYSAFERFDKVPIGWSPFTPRPYGNATFAYSVGDHVAIVYNEGNVVVDGMKDGRDAAKKEACAKWLTNVMVFALGQPTGINVRK